MSVQAAAPASSAVRFDSVGLAYGGHGPEVLKDVDGVSFTFFSARDVVRHALVQRIVEAYEAQGGEEQ